MPVDLRHFRSFVIVAEEGNIGRAARRLFITQPALSRQMQQLERSIGTTLLLRSARGVELTAAGREVLVKARRTLEAAEETMAVGRNDEPRGRLALGLTMAGRREDWYGVCEAFTDRYPDVQIEVSHAKSEQLQRQVVSGELHAAITLSPARHAPLSYDVVRTDPLSVWMHRGHPLADRPEITLAELEGQAITVLGGPTDEASGFNAAVRGLFDGTGITPEFVGTADVYPGMAARDPGYLGISPPLDFPDDVVEVPLVPARTMAYEVARRTETQTAAVRAFGPFAREHFSRSRDDHSRRA